MSKVNVHFLLIVSKKPLGRNDNLNSSVTTDEAPKIVNKRCKSS